MSGGGDFMNFRTTAGAYRAAAAAVASSDVVDEDATPGAHGRDGKDLLTRHARSTRKAADWTVDLPADAVVADVVPAKTSSAD